MSIDPMVQNQRAEIRRRETPALRRMLETLRQCDEDRAQKKNGIGFNRRDGDPGRDLLADPQWNEAQYLDARDRLFKYWRQLDEQDFIDVWGAKALGALKARTGRNEGQGERAPARTSAPADSTPLDGERKGNGHRNRQYTAPWAHTVVEERSDEAFERWANENLARLATPRTHRAQHA